MQTYEIWSEGYCATGDHGTAVFWGTVQASSFEDACKVFASRHPDFSKYFDEERLSYWGCRLFDNEKDARASFG